MTQAGLAAATSAIDVGAGTSRVVDALLARGPHDPTVLDMSEAALDATRARLGTSGQTVSWIVGDITLWRPTRTYDLWHDRAVFHFLTDPKDRTAYIDALSSALAPGAHAITATFAPDGPETCSGLRVTRYSPATLAETLGGAIRPCRQARLQPHNSVGTHAIVPIQPVSAPLMPAPPCSPTWLRWPKREE
ncbi:class I SAM-dependent methyltransferase [Roseinatronobacter sp. NSM]|uniref:class I SAM-dependent methyltransferase n=1 Tax=Roseinatronobacter sp. NSM TaxID=3457785 RepID=UPI0040358756